VTDLKMHGGNMKLMKLTP